MTFLAVPFGKLFEGRKFLMVLACFCFYGRLSAQVTAMPPDSNAFLKIYSTYITSVGGASLLFNGPEYTASYPGTTGSPFFMGLFFGRGMLAYGGNIYYNIPLAFDLVSDEVVTKGFQGLNMKLVEEKLDSFSIDGHVFVHLRKDTAHTGMPADDIYEQLFKDSLQVLVKRNRQSIASLHADDPRRFADYNTYYVVKAGNYYEVTDKKSMIKIFPDKSSALKSFWKSNKINFKKKREDAIVRTVQFYTQLKH